MGSNKNERNFLHIPKLRHFDVVVVNGVETGFVFQAEDEDDSVNPTGKLEDKKRENFDIEIVEIFSQKFLALASEIFCPL